MPIHEFIFGKWYNHHDWTVTVYDAHHHVIATLKPLQTVSFTVDAKDTWYGHVYFDGIYGDAINPVGHYQVIDAVYQSSWPAHSFPTLPVGGTSIVTADRDFRQPVNQAAQKVALDPALAAILYHFPKI